MEAEYLFRSYKEEDIPFIQSSWGSSYYSGISYRQLITPDEFHKFHRPARERFFSRPTATAIVCCGAKDRDLILGWLALEKPAASIIIHYIYVKEAFKEEKIASELLNGISSQGEVLFTHLTEKAQKIIRNNKDKYRRFVFAPHLI